MKYGKIGRVFMTLLVFAAAFTLFSACAGGSNADREEYIEQTVNNREFKGYWFNNEAELSRYSLKQARYGEIHEGDAVMIYVTEDFLKGKQVKFERGSYSGVTPVMKLNMTRNFNTGIYPYSLMTSVFTPLYDNHRETYKITASIQEWCGQSYFQLNSRWNKLHIRQHSYFQNEGDKAFSLKKVLLEDEIWTKLRIDPTDVPQGKVDMLPAFHYARLRHTEPAIEKAEIFLAGEISYKEVDSKVSRLRIEYETIDRIVNIYYSPVFPYEIYGWDEEYKSGFGPDAQTLKTEGVKTHSIKLDYWSKHFNKDLLYREALGLEK